MPQTGCVMVPCSHALFLSNSFPYLAFAFMIRVRLHFFVESVENKTRLFIEGIGATRTLARRNLSTWVLLGDQDPPDGGEAGSLLAIGRETTHRSGACSANPGRRTSPQVADERLGGDASADQRSRPVCEYGCCTDPPSKSLSTVRWPSAPAP